MKEIALWRDDSLHSWEEQIPRCARNENQEPEKLVGRPGFVGGVAEGFEGAVGAAGFAGQAYLATVVDDAVGVIDPLVLRDDFDEVAFDLDGVGVCCEFETL